MELSKIKRALAHGAPVIVFMALVGSSAVASVGSYCAAESRIEGDLRQALADTIAAKGSYYAAADTIKSFLEYRSVTATNIVFIIMAVWSASRIEFCLMRLTNYTYSEGQDLGKFWRDRLRAMLTMVITICSIALAVVFIVYGKVIFDTLLGIIPIL